MRDYSQTFGEVSFVTLATAAREVNVTTPPAKGLWPSARYEGQTAGPQKSGRLDNDPPAALNSPRRSAP